MEIAKLIRAIVSSDVLVVSNEYYVIGYKLCSGRLTNLKSMEGGKTLLLISKIS